MVHPDVVSFQLILTSKDEETRLCCCSNWCERTLIVLPVVSCIFKVPTPRNKD